jgi:ankyrin repeat protein
MKATPNDEQQFILEKDQERTERLRGLLLGCNGCRQLSGIHFLLTRGARVNAPYMNEDLETTYAIVEILQNKHWNDDWIFQKIRLLCRFGANVNVRDVNGKTPLCLVMYHKGCNGQKQEMLEIKVGRLLLHYGAKSRPTILCHTVQRKTVAHILLLLDIGVDVDEIDRESGRNALMIAMDLERWGAARLLLLRGASYVMKWYDKEDERWYELNLLHEACYTGNLDRIRCLVEHEAAWATKNLWWYNMPLVMAMNGCHHDAVYYLIQRLVLTSLSPFRGY